MKKGKFLLAALSLLLAFTLVLGACNKGRDETVAVDSVAITATDFELTVNDTKQLYANVNPATATVKTITWSTDAAAIATVSETGLVTARAVGNAIITATSNNGKKDSVTVTVKEAAATAVLDGITVKTPQTKTEYEIGEAFDPTGLVITASYTEDEPDKDIPYAGNQSKFAFTPAEFDTAGDGIEVEITYTEGGVSKKTDATVTVNAPLPVIYEIEVTDDGDFEYFVGDTVSDDDALDGLEVTAHYTEDKPSEILERDEFVITEKTFDSAGDAIPVEVSLAADLTVKTTFNVKVVEVPDAEIDAIDAVINGGKTFYEGDALNKADITVTAHYDDGITTRVLPASDFNLSNNTALSVPSVVVTVTLAADESITDTVTVPVTALEITDIEVTAPIKDSYFVGDPLDLSGLSVTAIYNKPGKVEVLEDGFTVSKANGYEFAVGDIDEEFEIVVTLDANGDIQTSFTVEVKAVEIVRIEVAEGPTTDSYFVGDALDLSGLSVTAIYNNGDEDELESGFTTSTADGYEFKVGDIDEEFEIIVTLDADGAIYTSFTVEVKAVEVSTIEIDASSSHNITYIEGANFSPAGLKIKITYNNDKSEIADYNGDDFELIAAGVDGEIDLTEPLADGQVTVTVKHKASEKTAEPFIVTVNQDVLDSLSVTPPTKLTGYIEGQTLDIAGMSVTAVYESGAEVPLSEGDYEIEYQNGGGAFAVGETKVTIRYGEKAYEITLDAVAAKQVIEIAISAEPNTKNYTVGDTLDLAGLEVTATYDNGTSGVIADGYTVSPANGAALNTEGTVTVTVTHTASGETDTFTVSVYPVTTVTGISVASAPTKIFYGVGDNVDTAGLTLDIADSNPDNNQSGVAFNTGDFSLSSNANNLTRGETIITVTHNLSGNTATFTVEAGIAATGVTPSEKNATLTVGGIVDLDFVLTPTDVDTKGFLWASDDLLVATVDQDGVVTAVGTGTAAISVTVTNFDGTTVSTTCMITVNPAPVNATKVVIEDAAGVELEQDALDGENGGHVLTIDLSDEPVTLRARYTDDSGITATAGFSAKSLQDWADASHGEYAAHADFSADGAVATFTITPLKAHTDSHSRLILNTTIAETAGTHSLYVVVTGGGPIDGATQIRTLAEFKAMEANGNYALAADIDFENELYTASLFSWFNFAGQLNGRGYALKNINLGGSGNFAFISQYNLSATAVIENVNFLNVIIGGTGNIALIGENKSGSAVKNCFFEVNLLSRNQQSSVFQAFNAGGILTNCVFRVNYGGGTAALQAAGNNNPRVITGNCYDAGGMANNFIQIVTVADAAKVWGVNNGGADLVASAPGAYAYKTAAELATAATFADASWGEAWSFEDGKYPELKQRYVDEDARARWTALRAWLTDTASGEYILDGDVDAFETYVNPFFATKDMAANTVLKSAEGENYTVSNLVIDATGKSDQIGLFKGAGLNTVISDITFDSPKIMGGNGRAGLLVGFVANDALSVSNVHVNSMYMKVTSGSNGGLISDISDSSTASITNSSVEVIIDMSGGSMIGAVAGVVQGNSTLTVTDTDVKVFTLGYNANRIGGVIGKIAATNTRVVIEGGTVNANLNMYGDRSGGVVAEIEGAGNGQGALTFPIDENTVKGLHIIDTVINVTANKGGDQDNFGGILGCIANNTVTSVKNITLTTDGDTPCNQGSEISPKGDVANYYNRYHGRGGDNNSGRFYVDNVQTNGN